LVPLSTNFSFDFGFTPNDFLGEFQMYLVTYLPLTYWDLATNTTTNLLFQVPMSLCIGKKTLEIINIFVLHIRVNLNSFRLTTLTDPSASSIKERFYRNLNAAAVVIPVPTVSELLWRCQRFPLTTQRCFDLVVLAKLPDLDQTRRFMKAILRKSKRD
jgi:hypothetical protein